MTIVISKVSDDPRALYKHPSDAITIAAELKEDVDVMQPSFYVVYNSSIVDNHYNYLAAFGRFYFITDISVTTGGAMRIRCREDVLYTYAAQIVNLPIIAERSDSTYNAFINDGQRRFYQYTQHQYVILEDLGKPNIICMLTVG